ncbi:hypothetical protein WR25_08771 [Diploscapter pachys]|uniref:Uncharacterized protein n=1 Tax=Diploscapter pachys TaxID=2018661 RepID=A0A2A2JWX2_9BILA|nr:hypothetical protein WR25_08771 [Diploscapter pachys]
MRFELVAIRVEKVQRVSLAAVLLPQAHVVLAQALGEGREVALANGKRVVRVRALQVARLYLIDRQAQPQLAQAQIGTPLPPSTEPEAQYLLVEHDAVGEVGDGQGQERFAGRGKRQRPAKRRSYPRTHQRGIEQAPLVIPGIALIGGVLLPPRGALDLHQAVGLVRIKAGDKQLEGVLVLHDKGRRVCGKLGLDAVQTPTTPAGCPGQSHTATTLFNSLLTIYKPSPGVTGAVCRFAISPGHRHVEEVLLRIRTHAQPLHQCPGGCVDARGVTDDLKQPKGRPRVGQARAGRLECVALAPVFTPEDPADFDMRAARYLVPGRGQAKPADKRAILLALDRDKAETVRLQVPIALGKHRAGFSGRQYCRVVVAPDFGVGVDEGKGFDVPLCPRAQDKTRSLDEHG